MLVANATIIPELVRLQDQSAQLFTRLLERRNFNRTPEQVQLGVPDNSVAFAGEFSFAEGCGSYVFFESKTKRPGTLPKGAGH